MNARRWIAGALAVVPMFTCSAALAARDGYKAEDLESSFPFTCLVFALVFLAGVCVVGFRDSKRRLLN